ncbi:hypothetical protein HFO84_35675 [Rhizobium leguminosarum]|uniref:hypothetical protein n=1 Tax=Rhizobium leguminosarum TaxID=384 RepID=UPI001C940052|nr:hypothetical protein [Rhizobium leguminosarum]MBY5482613.1 hypothetical protein [Rhizobium leguminosarum]
MPRQADPTNEIGRRATERWRNGLHAAAIPEACHVDTAIAAAVAVIVADRHERDVALSPELQVVLSATKAILKKRGFNGRAVTRKLQTRLLARKDIATLQRAVSDASGGTSL